MVIFSLIITFNPFFPSSHCLHPSSRHFLYALEGGQLKLPVASSVEKETAREERRWMKSLPGIEEIWHQVEGVARGLSFLDSTHIYHVTLHVALIGTFWEMQDSISTGQMQKQLTCPSSLSKAVSDWEIDRFPDNKLIAEAYSDTLQSSVVFFLFQR